LILERYDEILWTGLIWLRIGTGGRLLWTRERTFGSVNCGKFLNSWISDGLSRRVQLHESNPSVLERLLVGCQRAINLSQSLSRCERLRHCEEWEAGSVVYEEEHSHRICHIVRLSLVLKLQTLFKRIKPT
jgi:hypothetical protein